MVWDGDRPLDDDQAGSTYDELYERCLESAPAPFWCTHAHGRGVDCATPVQVAVGLGRE
ncbi:hypothetical protein [Streptomyces sp. NPDC048295]|uniref:hypothetical protein n=1 Tax=Streptomyces sp. NPDC048295 TaxID=3154617 RepID=UPI00342A9D42